MGELPDNPEPTITSWEKDDLRKAAREHNALMAKDSKHPSASAAAEEARARAQKAISAIEESAMKRMGEDYKGVLFTPPDNGEKQ